MEISAFKTSNIGRWQCMDAGRGGSLDGGARGAMWEAHFSRGLNNVKGDEQADVPWGGNKPAIVKAQKEMLSCFLVSFGDLDKRKKNMFGVSTCTSSVLVLHYSGREIGKGQLLPPPPGVCSKGTLNHGREGPSKHPWLNPQSFPPETARCIHAWHSGHVTWVW